jgi:ankyrin repeat protein
MSQRSRNTDDAAVVKFLVSKGADINAKTDGGSTPLDWAEARYFRGNTAAIQYLSSQGAVSTPTGQAQVEIDVFWAAAYRTDVNAVDDWDCTPLYGAVSMYPDHSMAFIKWLFSKGADVNVKAKYNGRTPLHEILNRLGNKYTLSWNKPDRQYIDFVKFLVSEGADVNVSDDNGWTPLHHVALFDRETEVAEFLIEQGANIHAKDKNGSTPLHLTVYKGIETTKLLVSKGADVNAENEEGMTPLHKAACGYVTFFSYAEQEYVGDVEILECLLSHGAKVNARDKNDATPLHLAVINKSRFKSNLAVVQYLVSQGADVTAKDKDGKTPLDLAKEKENADIAEYLESVK